MTTVTIGPDDNGEAFTLRLSDTVLLKLPENPTTGVRWQLPESLGPIRLTQDTYEPAGGAIGAASLRVLEFRAETQGQIHLHLRRLQAWEGDQSVDAEFTVMIRVMEK